MVRNFLGRRFLEKTRPVKRNFILLVLNFTFWRIGWIFKTESVIMPGFVLSLTNSGTVRGLLPLASRIGSSIPQFFVAHWISSKPLKKWVFTGVSLIAAFPWAMLVLLLKMAPGENTLLLSGFIFFYWINWRCIRLLNGIVQGKLIPALMRGKLAGISSFLGCAIAALVAYIFMPGWLKETSSDIFLGIYITSTIDEPRHWGQKVV